MARTIKPEEYALKRNQIVDAALVQMMTRGFNALIIQDVLDEIHISSGAFHHYFESRDALLDALIERLLQQSEGALVPLVRDPHLSALQKLQGFFGTLDRMRAARREDIARMSKVWFGDENAVVRKKMDDAVIEHRAPLLSEIVSQGIQEGVFQVNHPGLAGEIILALQQGMANAHIRLLSRVRQECAPEKIQEIVTDIVMAHTAYMEAIERVLGAPANCLDRVGPEVAMMWVNVMRETH